MLSLTVEIVSASVGPVVGREPQIGRWLNVASVSYHPDRRFARQLRLQGLYETLVKTRYSWISRNDDYQVLPTIRIQTFLDPTTLGYHVSLDSVASEHRLLHLRTWAEKGRYSKVLTLPVEHYFFFTKNYCNGGEIANPLLIVIWLQFFFLSLFGTEQWTISHEENTQKV